MILRQLFDHTTYTYTYLLGDENTKEAVLIDPVDTQVDSYLRLLKELGLTLTVALDTHVHADHITALGRLREATGAATYLGNSGDVECSDNALAEGQEIQVGNILVRVLFTPGHTDDSYTYVVNADDSTLAFTGDTLLIRGTGRTDFQNGDAEKLYESLHEKILTLPDETIVYPGHDYKGWSTSTIAEEKQHNPRLLLKTKSEFVAFMNNLKLPNPKFMDVAVPANQKCGQRQENH